MVTTLLLAAAIAQIPAPTVSELGVPGLDNVFASDGQVDGDLTGGIHIGYLQSKDLLVEGDFHEQQRLRLALAWSPWKMVTLAYAHTILASFNDAFAPASRDTIGDPRFTASAGYELSESVSMGLVTHLWVPTGGGRGASLNALTSSFLGVVTAHTGPIRTAVNVGYRLDRTNLTFPEKRDPAYEFAGRVASSDVILFGLGVESAHRVADNLVALPFGELNVEYSPIVQASSTPAWGTLGVKVASNEYPWEARLGARIRITGAPQDLGKLPGIAPFEGFAGATYRFTAVAMGARSCSRDVDCDAPQTCVAEVCTAIVEKTVEKIVERVVEKTVVEAAPTFVLAGTVKDSKSGKPVPWARVAVGTGDTRTVYAVDDEGNYRSAAMVVQTGILPVQVVAKGYEVTDTALQYGTAGQVLEGPLVLVPTGQATGTLKGKIISRRGKPVAGCNITMASLKLKKTSDAQGAFEIELPLGAFAVALKCRGYVDQTIRAEFKRPGEVIIVNPDMERRRR